MNDELQTRMVRLPTLAGDQACLVIIAAPATDTENPPGRVYRLRSYTKIGRLKTNDVVLDGTSVSREHCVIEHRADGYFVLDEGSANGTVVGGKKLRDGQLHRKETLVIGEYQLLFWQGAPDDPALRELIPAPPC